MCTQLSRLAVLVAALFLSACSMSPAQKRWTAFAAGVLVVGAIAAHDADNGKALPLPNVATPRVPCDSNPDLCR